jgi:putative flippase GtrA
MMALVPALVGHLTGPLLRWLIVGGLFEVVATPLLYVLHGIWLVPLLVATFLVAELTTLPRFFVNDRFVFGWRRPSWRRLWQYHAACAGSFAVWYVVANLLPLLGLHYVLASLSATVCSVGLALASNFGWIWRRSSNREAQAASPDLAISLS